MKKRIAILCLFLILALCAPALAAVSATPNQKLAFRSGPNTKYTELGTWPQSTRISAIEYESGNDVTWVLVEFSYSGQTWRGYTGLKRMTVNGNIPWANHLWQRVWIISDGEVLAAPSTNAAYRGWLNDGDQATLLRYESNGYAYVEFSDGGTPSRGWVEDWRIDDGSSSYNNYNNYESSKDNHNTYNNSTNNTTPNNWALTPALNGAPAACNQQLTLRNGPSSDYAWYGSLAAGSSFNAIQYEQHNGSTWVLVEFMDGNDVVRSYTSAQRILLDCPIPLVNYASVARYSDLAARADVYAAPVTNAAWRDQLGYGETVIVLEVDGSYAYVEYLGSDNALSRGYISSTALGSFYDE